MQYIFTMWIYAQSRVNFNNNYIFFSFNKFFVLKKKNIKIIKYKKI